MSPITQDILLALASFIRTGGGDDKYLEYILENIWANCEDQVASELENLTTK